ncbi:hypothetical protein Fuma_06677 [Fuerstiella marisgermanici]|uniref:Uncharacterized protein n=1 Tax=Fuerstiella marisgermanici TaxID=1891926 RepID=A0A1P8WSH7_9PLAN|nr:hypothetical protein Fuma_06677 [Fuerstiella marisgermanici]
MTIAKRQNEADRNGEPADNSQSDGFPFAEPISCVRGLRRQDR